MKTLQRFSYGCAALLAALSMMMLFFLLDDPSFSFDQSLLGIAAWAFFSITQFVYTVKTGQTLRLEEYKPTDSLDDFAMNEMELTDEVVQHGLLLKGIATINSIFLCFYFMSSASGLLRYMELLFTHASASDKIMAFIRFALLVCTFPTIIYNLRTFRIVRIRRLTSGEIE